ncbi:hypothetical protein [Methylobacterium sp. SD21]|uniref:hypothetical protein n=1 Tax=Methylobacterium litchii TaxID=3138810 RepID=UPI00313E53B1
MSELLRDWRRQVSQDTEVTKGGLRIAWFLTEHPEFAHDGCLLDDAAIGAATGMHPHSVANSISILRGLGHIACRKITNDDRRLRQIRPAYLRGGRDVVASDSDAPEHSTMSPVSNLSTSDRIKPEPASLEQGTASLSEPLHDAVRPPVEQVDPGSVSGSTPPHASSDTIRHSNDPISMHWQLESEDAWERDLRGWKLPVRCQKSACDRPTAFLCLQTQQGFCRRHQKYAIIPVPLSLSALSEI